jgi:hypothetical protein
MRRRGCFLILLSVCLDARKSTRFSFRSDIQPVLLCMSCCFDGCYLVLWNRTAIILWQLWHSRADCFSSNSVDVNSTITFFSSPSNPIKPYHVYGSGKRCYWNACTLAYISSVIIIFRRSQWPRIHMFCRHLLTTPPPYDATSSST